MWLLGANKEVCSDVGAGLSSFAGLLTSAIINERIVITIMLTKIMVLCFWGDEAMVLVVKLLLESRELYNFRCSSMPDKVTFF